MNKIKLVATLGPACQDKNILKEMIQNGLNVARFNFSHAQYEQSEKMLKLITEINQELNTSVATMLDTKGPEIRTHDFDGAVTIAKNDEVRIVFEEVLGTKEKFSVSYFYLYDELKIGDRIFIDDGYLTLEVTAKDKSRRELITKAYNTHIVKSRRGVNVPDIKLKMPYLSAKDKADIVFACQKGYDFVALSFVRKVQDVLDVKKILKEQNNTTLQIIAKIENQEGMDNLYDIIKVVDGIMVARGDLGIEVDDVLVPIYQTEMIEKCNEAGKFVIVATQMLESMQKNPRPTKAEISDVFNAVFQGATSTMLSGESASGLYPVQAVSYMAKIQKQAEEYMDSNMTTHNSYLPQTPDEFFVFGVFQMALCGQVDVIIVDDVKYSRALAKFHTPVPVLTKTKDLSQATALALDFSNIPYWNSEQLNQKLKQIQTKLDKELNILTIENNILKLENKSKDIDCKECSCF